MLVPLMTVPILIFSIILVITSVALALFVLMHKGRGGGLSDLFGGGISSSLGGSSVAERNLDRLYRHRSGLASGNRRAQLALQAGRLTVQPPAGQLTRNSNSSTARKGEENERGWWKRHSWQSGGAGPMGEAERGDAARGITSRTSAHTVMRRGPHLLQMPQFPTPGLPAAASANLDSGIHRRRRRSSRTRLTWRTSGAPHRQGGGRILTEALQALRARRERGEVIY